MEQLKYHLVHANVARIRAPLDDPSMEGFTSQIEEIDRLASQSPGFVAQPIPTDQGTIYSDAYLVNISVWTSVDSLFDFTYRGRHLQALKQRADWFEQSAGPAYVLYWAPVSHLPTEREIAERFAYLQAHGPTPHAFTFGQRYTVKDMLSYPVLPRDLE